MLRSHHHPDHDYHHHGHDPDHDHDDPGPGPGPGAQARTQKQERRVVKRSLEIVKHFIVWFSGLKSRTLICKKNCIWEVFQRQSHTVD